MHNSQIAAECFSLVSIKGSNDGSDEPDGEFPPNPNLTHGRKRSSGILNPSQINFTISTFLLHCCTIATCQEPFSSAKLLFE